jgi:hypothetical protein
MTSIPSVVQDVRRYCIIDAAAAAALCDSVLFPTYINSLHHVCLFVCRASLYDISSRRGLLLNVFGSSSLMTRQQSYNHWPALQVLLCNSTVVKFSKCLEERGETHNTVAFFGSFLPSFLIVPLVHVSQLPEKSPVHYMRNPSLDCYIAPRWLNPPGIVCCRSNGWIKINNAPLRLIRHWKFFFFFCYCRKMDVSY